ncbi:MAG: hypothetical protein JSS61_00905 [Verrucomicrobia bacterium]|nr:hypothetical protein [Verrucomicrobiota bacterium]
MSTSTISQGVTWDRCTVISPSIWEEHVDLEGHDLSFKDLKSRELQGSTPIRDAVSDLVNHVEDDEGVSVIFIPKGHSLSKMRAIAKSAGIKEYDVEGFMDRISPAETERAYVMVISNSLLCYSADKTPEERDQLVRKLGYEVPSTAELLTAIVFHRIIHSKPLFYDTDLRNFSLTSDQVDKYRPSLTSTESGFQVHFHYSNLFSGAAGVKRFYAIES